MAKRAVTLTVNDETRELFVEPRRLLIEALRDDLGLTGTKRGCEEGVCGCCTVLIDGRHVRACLMLTLQARGRSITTIEGLRGADGGLDPVQEAFIEHGALQCGYCTPGFVMTTKAFLRDCPSPTEAQVREGLSGNICRCTGYVKIVEAVLALAQQPTRTGS
jgi:aerobic carbon-monoxide dehydrogenase small subunit